MEFDSNQQFMDLNKVKFCLNKFEQEKEIQSRITYLVTCLKLTENIRNETESAKIQIKSKLNDSFEHAFLNLNKLVTKLYDAIEKQLISKQIDISLRNIECDIHQLIGKLTSLSMLSDSEKLLLLKHMDQCIKQIENNVQLVSNYKRIEIDTLLDEGEHVHSLVKNQVDRLNNFLLDERLALSSKPLVKSNSSTDNNQDLKNWLLQTNASESEEKLTNEKRSNSFEFIDFNKELDSIQVFTDFDDNLKQTKYIDETSKLTVDADDGHSLTFHSIYSKPTDYWLLSKQTAK